MQGPGFRHLRRGYERRTLREVTTPGSAGSEPRANLRGRRRQKIAFVVLVIALAGVAAFVFVRARAFAAARARESEALRVAGLPHAIVATPAHRLANVVVSAPDALWSSAQRGVGGVVGLLPNEAAPVVFAALELDPVLAREVDGREPFVVAVGLEGERMTFAAACLVKDGPKVLRVFAAVPSAGASKGSKDASPFTQLRGGVGRRANGAAPDEGDAGADPSNALDASIVVAAGPRGELVVASGEDALAKLGPFAAFTLLPEARIKGVKPALVVDVPRDAIANVAVPALGAAWSRTRGDLLRLLEEAKKEHGDAPPDFGDPEAVFEGLDAFVRDEVASFARVARIQVAMRSTETGLVAVARAEDVGARAADGGRDQNEERERERERASSESNLAQTIARTPDDAILGMVRASDDRDRVVSLSADGSADGGAEDGSLVERLLATHVRDEDVDRVRGALATWNASRAGAFGMTAAFDDGARFDVWSEVRDGGNPSPPVQRPLARRRKFTRPVLLSTRTEGGWQSVRVGRRALVAPETRATSNDGGREKEGLGERDAGANTTAPLAVKAVPLEELAALLGGTPTSVLFFDASRLHVPPFDVLPPSATVLFGARGDGRGRDAALSVPFAFLRAAVDASRTH